MNIFILLDDMLDKDSFEEIWLHEGCSVWTPGIYLKGTRITGIKGVLESSAKLVRINNSLIRFRTFI